MSASNADVADKGTSRATMKERKRMGRMSVAMGTVTVLSQHDTTKHKDYMDLWKFEHTDISVTRKI
jgi:hypothetical protein